MCIARLGLGSVLAAVGSGIVRGCAVLTPLVAVTALVAPAQAQIKDVPAYTAVVFGEGASIRCGAGMYYKVCELPKGTHVQVDGEDGQWARIIYPAGTPAFVKADDAKADEAAGTVRLLVESQLRAINVVGGMPWKSLLDTALPVGTSFKLLETIKENGAVIGYKVVAPPGAKGYVELKALRKEKPAEAGGATPQVKPAPTPAETPPAAKPATPGNLLEPIQTGSPVPGAQPAVPAKTDAEPVRPAPRRVGTLDELEAAFQNVRKQPPAEAEYGALIAEFQRAIGQTSATPDGGSRKRQLERRRDFLKIQAEARDKQLALERTKKEIDENAGRVNQRLADLERQRVYTIIGLLVPSTVYDGKNLPLMYRLQAVGITAPPTIGYLAPKPELKLETKLGMVVGVVGESTIDKALSLNVINPVRVDILQAADGKEPSPSTPPVAPSAAVPTNK